AGTRHADAQPRFDGRHWVAWPGAVNPNGPLVRGNDGNIYGTTSSGGAANVGTVFRMTPDGAITILHEFTGLGSDGAFPQSGLICSTDGTLYGTTSEGGEFSAGTVFTVTDGGVVSTLHSFDYNPGGYPVGALVQGVDGHLYGTTFAAVDGYGTAFRITLEGVITTLHTFTGGAGDGAYPAGALVQVAENFYGMTQRGG